MKNLFVLLLVLLFCDTSLSQKTNNPRKPISFNNDLTSSFLQQNEIKLAGTGKTNAGIPWEINSLLEEIRKEYNLPAVAAAATHTDGIIAVGATGLRVISKPNQATAADKFNIGSITKPMTATVIATLVEEGKLAWITRVLDVFPEYNDSPYAQRDYS